MVDRAFKIRENRVRRIADRRGMSLKKSRRRDPNALEYGGYMLVDYSTSLIVFGSGAFAFNATLEEVEEFLKLGEE